MTCRRSRELLSREIAPDMRAMGMPHAAAVAEECHRMGGTMKRSALNVGLKGFDSFAVILGADRPEGGDDPHSIREDTGDDFPFPRVFHLTPPSRSRKRGSRTRSL